MPSVVLASLTALTLSATAARQPTVEIPTEKTPYQIVIRMKISGKEAKFALDSGSFEVRLQRSSAEKLGLVQPLVAELRPAAGQIAQWMEGEFEIGGNKFGKQPYAVMPMYVQADGTPMEHKDYDGIIGLDFLRKHAWGFDLIRNRVAIWKGGKVGAKDTEAWTSGNPIAVPLFTEGKQDWYRLDGTLNRIPTRFALDTGAPHLLVMKEKAESYGFAIVSSTSLNFLGASKEGSVGLGTEVGFPWRVRTTPIAALVSYVDLLTFGELGTDAVVGYDQFLNAKTIFDFPAKRLTTAPDKEIVRWSRYLGSFGFRIGPTDGKPSAFVRPGGPADRAGVKSGDIIEAIDGVPATLSSETKPPARWEERNDLSLRVRRGES